MRSDAGAVIVSLVILVALAVVFWIAIADAAALYWRCLRDDYRTLVKRRKG